MIDDSENNMPLSEDLIKARNNYPQVPESIFKPFLDLFLDPEGNPNERKRWLEYSLDPRNSVWVVDDLTGERLFRVPPLTYTSDNLVGHRIYEKHLEWSLEENRHPKLGDRFGATVLTSDLITGKPPEEDIQQWREILERYDRIPKSAEIGGPTADLLESDPDDW